MGHESSGLSFLDYVTHPMDSVQIRFPDKEEEQFRYHHSVKHDSVSANVRLGSQEVRALLPRSGVTKNIRSII
jgi:hypothetical protein